MKVFACQKQGILVIKKDRGTRREIISPWGDMQTTEAPLSKLLIVLKKCIFKIVYILKDR
jgi:hypothetical protein